MAPYIDEMTMRINREAETYDRDILISANLKIAVQIAKKEMSDLLLQLSKTQGQPNKTKEVADKEKDKLQILHYFRYKDGKIQAFVHYAPEDFTVDGLEEPIDENLLEKYSYIQKVSGRGRLRDEMETLLDKEECFDGEYQTVIKTEYRNFLLPIQITEESFDHDKKGEFFELIRGARVLSGTDKF